MCMCGVKNAFEKCFKKTIKLNKKANKHSESLEKRFENKKLTV